MPRGLTDPLAAVAHWAAQAAVATDSRNEAIRSAHAAGLSLRAIAGAASLSHAAVAKIVHRAS
jgi:hypothetical protein